MIRASVMHRSDEGNRFDHDDYDDEHIDVAAAGAAPSRITPQMQVSEMIHS
jgi:hypothetical protein